MLPPPFTSKPTRPLIQRPRLLDALAKRFDRRLTVVRAGAGFGKTALLHQATEATREGGSGNLDFWLSLSPARRYLEPLQASLRNLLEARKESSDSVQAIADAVWRRAPAHCALVIDDGHEIERGSDAAAFFAKLLASLPENGHLVWVSREDPPFAISRLVAQGAAGIIVEADLAFDESEIAAFGALRDVDPAALRDTGGWPAVLELRADVGEPHVVDFLWDEVLSRLDTERAATLARLSIIAEFDDDLVRDLTGSSMKAADLVEGLPLTSIGERGGVRLHPLWQPVLARFAESQDPENAQRAIDSLCSRGEALRAAELCLETEDPQRLMPLIRALARTAAQRLPGDVLADLAARLPAHHLDTPTGYLVQGFAALVKDPERAERLLTNASEAFTAEDDRPAALQALAARIRSAYWRGDTAKLQQLIGLVEALSADLDEPPPLAWQGRIMIELAIGRGEAALEHIERIRALEIDPGLDALLASLATMAAMTAGLPDRAHVEADAALGHPIPAFRANALGVQTEARWLLGTLSEADIEASSARLTDTTDGARQNLAILHGVMAQMFASIGRLDAGREELRRAEPSLARAIGSGPAAVNAISHAALLVLDGDEDAAREILRGHLDAHPMGERPHRVHLRGTAFFYALVPETRKEFDRHALGPAYEVVREATVAWIAWRDSQQVDLAAALDWTAWRRFACLMVPPWLHELAVAAIAGGNDEARIALEESPTDPRPTLRRLRSAKTRAVARSAKALLASLPLPPSHRVEIHALGPLAVLRDGEPVADANTRRERVRSLLRLLIARRRCSRAVAGSVLWPEHDEESVRNNLRVTLSHLQRVLDPDRDAGEPGWFLRADSEQLVLADVDELTIDVDQFEAHLDAAERAEAKADPAASLDHRLAACALYRGDYLEGADDEEWADLDRTRLRSRFVESATRAGELLIAHADARKAIGLLGRAIEVDPFCEPAYRTIVQAFYSLGDRSAARKAIESCLRQLAELGVEPEIETQRLAGELGLPG